MAAMLPEFRQVAPMRQVLRHHSRQTAQIPVRGKGNRKGQGMGSGMDRMGLDKGQDKSQAETTQEAAALEAVTSEVAASEVATSEASVFSTVPAHRAICYHGLGLGPCPDLGPCPGLAPGHGPPNPGSRPRCLVCRGYPGHANSNHHHVHPMCQSGHRRLANCSWEVEAPVGPKQMSCRDSCNPSK